ncbi:split soret cytochrome c precursor [Thermincola ferriacetica]|uniref:Split soret cytochrome c n=1 Tax=Thermincola ferriacetica TaxID=281456 RepID=A0A0L6W164_9FIRM|nr:C-GCAxxG-C-C family protein [Thermincola ferriacetica]KNZ69123.1 split soret cytochrome c precursor [Thermincola ferriacetica]
MSDKNKFLENLSRRSFLVNAGKFAAGAMVGFSGLSLAGCAASPKESASEQASQNGPDVKIPKLPWPYKKLDPEVVRRKAHDNYYRDDAHCMETTFSTIVEELAKEVGFPYTVIPVEMAHYGAGGVMNWSTLCGALNGSCMAMNLVLGKKGDALEKAVNELMGWYTKAKFPSDQSNKFDGPKVKGPLPQSIGTSPLCHVSVSMWCNASGMKSFSPERAERCARLSGDTAAKAVEILNQYLEKGEITPVYADPASIQECGACHGKGGLIEDSRGKMDCVQCHEPHEKKPAK